METATPFRPASTDDVRELARAVRLLLRAVEDLTRAPAMGNDYGLSHAQRDDIESIVARLLKSTKGG